MGGDALQGARHYASKGETLLSLTDFTRGDINGRVGGGQCCIVKWQHCKSATSLGHVAGRHYRGRNQDNACEEFQGLIGVKTPQAEEAVGIASCDEDMSLVLAPWGRNQWRRRRCSCLSNTNSKGTCIWKRAV